MVFTTCTRPLPAGFEDGTDVLEDLPGLLGDAAVHQLAGGGIEPDLPRGEEEAAGAQRLAVGADGAGSPAGGHGLDRHQNRPSMVPSGCTLIASADGVLLSPGMVMISPASATTNPAPAEG